MYYVFKTRNFRALLMIAELLGLVILVLNDVPFPLGALRFGAQVCAWAHFSFGLGCLPFPALICDERIYMSVCPEAFHRAVTKAATDWCTGSFQRPEQHSLGWWWSSWRVFPALKETIYWQCINKHPNREAKGSASQAQTPFLYRPWEWSSCVKQTGMQLSPFTLLSQSGSRICKLLTRTSCAGDGGFSIEEQTPPADAFTNRFIITGEENESMWSLCAEPKKESGHSEADGNFLKGGYGKALKDK